MGGRGRGGYGAAGVLVERGDGDGEEGRHVCCCPRVVVVMLEVLGVVRDEGRSKRQVLVGSGSRAEGRIARAGDVAALRQDPRFPR